MNLTINIRKIFLFIILIAAVLFAFAQAPGDGPITRAIGVIPWIEENWPIILLGISEILALLPGKFSGLAQTVIQLILNSRKKRSRSISK